MVTECSTPVRWREFVAKFALMPVDIASSVVFRIGFGLIAAWWSLGDLISGRVAEIYAEPRFHFTYYLFDFVQPWSASAVNAHFVGLFVLALMIAFGCLYRLSAFLFATGFTYFFLWDRTNYQNHYYLIMLLSWLLALLPLGQSFSVDAQLGVMRQSSLIPGWCLGLLRFHIALPYLFGGVAKIHSDWFAGEPMRTHLTSIEWPSFLGPLMTSEVVVGILIWGGLAFDLAIVPMLLWNRTRWLAYFLCVVFHLTNAFLFEIHIFPWFMIVATTIFFPPDWPRHIFGNRSPSPQPPSIGVSWSTLPWSIRLGSGALVIYCVIQLLLPFRPFLYAGNSAWTERAHHFSWRMMMRSKTSALRYYVTDPKLGRTGTVDLRQFVSATQLASLSRDPEMILHLAHFIAEEFQRKTGREVEVRALVLTSLNGRKPELLIDPQVDLAKEPRGFYFRSWILPQQEPLRQIPWNVPITEWERHVAVPRNTFPSRAN